jgi:hypothetical protein
MVEQWVTDEDLRAAFDRFAAAIPGFAMPVAYGLARLDVHGCHFGYVNTIGAVRPLPAAVLASVCGYVCSTATFELTRNDVERAVTLLTPAEAATHMSHPNLWSWRELLGEGPPGATFQALFVANASDPPVDENDAQFRALI